MVKIINIEIIIHDQTQTDQIIHLIPVPIHTLGIDTIQTIDQEIHCTIDTEIIPTIDIQTPSHFTNEESVQTVTTTTQQSISPIHPNLTTPRLKNPTLL